MARTAGLLGGFVIDFWVIVDLWDMDGPGVILRGARVSWRARRCSALRYSGASTRVAAPFIATPSRLMPPLLRFLATQPDMLGGELR